MDDILPLSVDTQKKRQSGDTERPPVSAFASLEAPRPFSSSAQAKRGTSHSRSASTHLPSHQHHHATSSVSHQHALPQKKASSSSLSSSYSSSSPTPHPPQQHQGGGATKGAGGRRGSLPPLLKIHTNSYPAPASPIQQRSPYTSLPPLPEKGSISIQINQPGKTDLTRHLIEPQHQHLLKIALYILSWYFFSTSLSLYNKNLMGKDHFNFQFPLLVSAIHTGMHSLITLAMMTYDPDRWRPKDQALSMSNYIRKVVPCAVAAATEIGCANASLVFITLSFYTMIKSSVPVWVLLFAFMFGFEKPRWKLIMIILVIVSGVLLTVEGETKFDTTGFVLVLVASVASGLRWNMTQLLLQQDGIGIHSPIATMYYLSPIMFASTLTLSLLLEHPIAQFQQSDGAFHALESFGLMAIGGLLAFAMILSELYLIKNTNTVTLSVAGISKEVFVISLSVVIYGDVLTTQTIMGVIVSIMGIIWYNYYKLSKVPERSSYQMIPITSSNKNLDD